MAQDWNIKAPGDACSACGHRFTDKEPFSSKLTFDEAGYGRTDYCEACWAGHERDNALSVWKAVFSVPPPRTDEPLKKENAESLLRELMETEDAANRNVIYILAVMLERRRLLAEKDVQTREDGVKIRVYEHKKTGETFFIPDPELRLAEIEHVQREVLERLGLTPKPEVAPAAAARMGAERDDV